MHELPWEYWYPNILLNVARGIGIPLKIDQNTLDGNFGHFARILIKVDLSKELLESIMIERQGHKLVFFLFFFYFFIYLYRVRKFARILQKLPVRHSLANCKKNSINRNSDSKQEKPGMGNKKADTSQPMEAHKFRTHALNKTPAVDQSKEIPQETIDDASK